MSLEIDVLKKSMDEYLHVEKKRLENLIQLDKRLWKLLTLYTNKEENERNI